MTVFGAHVPVSGWTVVALVLGVALSLLGWRPLARWQRWRPAGTLATLLFLIAMLALTLTPGRHDRPAGLRACVPDDVSDLAFIVFHTGGGLVADLFNMLLMLPVTFSLMLATRRVRPALTVALLLPLAVELTQTMLPGRFCTMSDIVSNIFGGLLGVALSWLALRRSTSRA